MPTFKSFKKKKTVWNEMIEFLIADENEAIRSYDKAIEFVANADFDDIKKTAFLEKLNHIKNDEIDHVEKLMAMKGE